MPHPLAAAHEYKKFRQRARTDLIWLAWFMLGYKDVRYEVHGKMADTLQKFQGGDEEVEGRPDQRFHLRLGSYHPKIDKWELEGKRKTLILMPRGHLKCVCFGQQVQVCTGEYKRVENILVGDKVLSMTEDYRLVWSPVVARQVNVNQECVQIKFRSGRKLEVSANHPLRTLLGWAAAADLQIGDRVGLALKAEPEQGPYLPYAEIVGWFLGDGCFYEQSVANQNPLTRKQILAAAIRAGFDANEYVRSNKNAGVRVRGCCPLFRELGLWKTKAKTKFIPTQIFMADQQSVIECLRGLFFSDGCCAATGIFLTSISAQLVSDIQRLLRRIDVHSRVSQSARGYWHLSITSTGMVDRFLAQVGWGKKSTWQSKRKKELANTVPKEWTALVHLPKGWAHKLRPSTFNIHGAIAKSNLVEIAHKLNNPMLAQLAADDIFWDSVTNVSPIGSRSTVDLQIESGNFAISDIITHNTTIATIAYGIQWLLNYPDCRILLSSATGDQVAGFLREMKSHFQVNERFRYYFPDFCPHKNVKEFGNQDSFSLPNRQVLLSTGVQKEFSVKTVSVGAVVASAHYDVILNDDPVDKENVRTPEQIANVKSHLGYLWPLLETAPGADKRADGYRRGWWHYTGTPYDFSDASSSILDSEAALPEDKKTYFIYKQSALISGELSEEPCTKVACGLFGLHQLIDHAKTLWPSRMPARALLDIAKDPLQGYSLLSSQYLMNPIPEKSGLIESPDQIVWVPMDAIKKIYAYLSLHVTIDLAGMEPSTNKLADNDFTVINLHGFGHDGTLFILNVLRGRYTPMEVIDLLFNLAKLHPRVMDFKVEKEAHARVLLPFLKREMVKRQTWLPMVEIRRDNRTSKQQRIKGLQPWFRNGSIKFADNQPHKLAIINEIMRFPKFAHDDILDTIADAMQGRDGSLQSDILPMKNEQVASGMLDGKQDGDILYWKAARFEIPNIWEPKKDGGETEYVGTLDPLTGF